MEVPSWGGIFFTPLCRGRDFFSARLLVGGVIFSCDASRVGHRGGVLFFGKIREVCFFLVIRGRGFYFMIFGREGFLFPKSSTPHIVNGGPLSGNQIKNQCTSQCNSLGIMCEFDIYISDIFANVKFPIVWKTGRSPPGGGVVAPDLDRGGDQLGPSNPYPINPKNHVFKTLSILKIGFFRPYQSSK